jgi:hypothetical protein
MLSEVGWSYVGQAPVACSEGCGSFLDVATSPTGLAVLCRGCGEAWPLGLYDRDTVAVISDFVDRRAHAEARRGTSEWADYVIKMGPYEPAPSPERPHRTPVGDGPRTPPRGGAARHW